MSTDTEVPINQKLSIEFKSTSFSVPVLNIYSANINQINLQLGEKISQAPDFFRNSPLILDIHECNLQEQKLDLASLIDILHKNKLIPIAISGATKEQNNISLKRKIAVHNILKTDPVNNKKTGLLANEKKDIPSNAPAPTTETRPVENQLICHPVRSGQRIYAKGDLTILSHVSAGAEIMAEGNIHVYGALRGRALAGVQGNIKSRIFCSALEAELVSIAGHYKVNEELTKVEAKRPAQVFLQEQALIIKNL